MAAVTNAFVPTGDTANTTAYASSSFTPAAGELLVVFAALSGTVQATATCTASANGLTFTQVRRATKNVSADSLYMFVADQLVPASPSAMTVTVAVASDAATGGIVSVARVSGLTRTGTGAVRQSAQADNVAGGVAPSTVFASAADTANPTLFGIITGVSTGSTPPSGWTERVDVNYATPTTGGGYSSRDSGFTGTTITLGSTTNGTCAAIAAELDTTSAAASPATGTATVALTASGAVQAAAAGTASLALTASGTARAVAGGSAALSLTANLTATGSTRAAAAGTGAIVLTATADAAGTVDGTASLEIVGTATLAALATGTAMLALTATGLADTIEPPAPPRRILSAVLTIPTATGNLEPPGAVTAHLGAARIVRADLTIPVARGVLT